MPETRGKEYDGGQTSTFSFLSSNSQGNYGSIDQYTVGLEIFDNHNAADSIYTFKVAFIEVTLSS